MREPANWRGIWAGGELSSAPDFFRPLHVEHLISWAPAVLPYLGLPPGWRFLACDVGQGDGILVEGGRGGRLLIDGGPDPGRMLVVRD